MDLFKIFQVQVLLVYVNLNIANDLFFIYNYYPIAFCKSNMTLGPCKLTNFVDFKNSYLKLKKSKTLVIVEKSQHQIIDLPVVVVWFGQSA